MTPNAQATATAEREPYGLTKSIEAVKAAVSIPDYLQDQGVEVRRNRAVCIIHQGGNSQSFAVYPDEDRFFCFRCQAGGDVIDLCRAVEGGEVWEAVIVLAERFGVDVRTRPPSWEPWQDKKGRRRRMIRDNLAKSYQRRYFRAYYSEYLAELDPELRESEAKALWDGLQSLSFLCADRRLAA